MVYLMSVPGGWLADRVLGQRRAVLYGGILIAAGHYSLAVPLRRRSISASCSSCSARDSSSRTSASSSASSTAPKDIRRDAGVLDLLHGDQPRRVPRSAGHRLPRAGRTVPRARSTGWGMDPNSAWHWGFGAAGVGMTLGLMQYVLGGRALGTAGPRAGRRSLARRDERGTRSARWIYGGLAIGGARSGAACSRRPASITLTPTRVRDVAGYSLLIVTVVFFGELFLDRSWTPRGARTAVRHLRLLPVRGDLLVGVRAGRIDAEPLCRSQHAQRAPRLRAVPEQLVPVAERAVHHRLRAGLRLALGEARRTASRRARRSSRSASSASGSGFLVLVPGGARSRPTGRWSSAGLAHVGLSRSHVRGALPEPGRA